MKKISTPKSAVFPTPYSLLTQLDSGIKPYSYSSRQAGFQAKRKTYV